MARNNSESVGGEPNLKLFTITVGVPSTWNLAAILVPRAIASTVFVSGGAGGPSCTPICEQTKRAILSPSLGQLRM